MASEAEPLVSIVMVSLDCETVLRDCLVSLSKSSPALATEIVVVDNASRDGTISMLEMDFPNVRVIRNETNVGFSRATNQGVKATTAPFVLLLNTDTIVAPNTIAALVTFLQSKTTAAAVGPKVLNPDGSFQPQCRRGRPTPIASLLYMLKAHRMFPKSSWANSYLLEHLPTDEPAPVHAISGCCMMLKRDVWQRVGELDPAIFGYGEDVDWCLRARENGYEVWYDPTSEITHLKGKGGAHAKPFHKIWGIHQAMWVVYRKHFCRNWAMSALVFLGISGSFALACVSTAIKRVLHPSWPATSSQA